MLEHSLNFVYFTVELGGHFRYEVQLFVFSLEQLFRILTFRSRARLQWGPPLIILNCCLVALFLVKKLVLEHFLFEISLCLIARNEFKL